MLQVWSRSLVLWASTVGVATVAAAADWEPAHWPAPAIGVYAGPPSEPLPLGVLHRLYGWYRTYSAKDGAVCSFYPTCSAYGYAAVQEWGLIGGSILLTDRLLRENPRMSTLGHYKIVTPHSAPRFVDPAPKRRSRER
jgi:hypothetical protein